MDFAPVVYTAEQKRRTRNSILRPVALGFVLMFLIPALIVVGFESEVGLPNFFGVFSVILPVGGFFAFLYALFTPDTLREKRLRDRAESLRVAVGKRYGLELTEAEFSALAYPEEEPTTSFEVFGSIRRSKQLSGANFVEHTIYLVWADGQIQLSESEDGKHFSELRASDPQVS